MIDKLNNKNKNELFEIFIDFIVQFKLKKINKTIDYETDYLFSSTFFFKNKNILTLFVSKISISIFFTRISIFFILKISFSNSSSIIKF